VDQGPGLCEADETQLSYTTLYSPIFRSCSGQIKGNRRSGQIQGRPLSPSLDVKMFGEAYIPETDLSKVKWGQDADRDR